jgi:hypothetical protein
MPEDLREALDELEDIEAWFGVTDLCEGDMIEPMCARLNAQRQLVSALIAKYKTAFALEAMGA